MEKFFNWLRKNIVCRLVGHDGNMRRFFHTLPQGTVLEVYTVSCHRCHHPLKWRAIYVHRAEDQSPHLFLV